MNQNHFTQIQKALEYIEANFKRQPDLDEVAKALHMSPLHLQKVFTEWAGVSPKKFLQYISLEYAKDLLKKGYTTSESSLETGLSGNGRLYDLFVTIEGMTPGEFQDKGRNLTIEYSFSESDFGPVLVGSTDKGICYMGFADDHTHAFADMQSRFPNAKYVEHENEKHTQLLEAMAHRSNERIKLHLRGTPFQLKVWEALLKIPAGHVTTYGNLAEKVGNPKASRAVGTAVGDNPVSILIPCHRVIQSTGVFGNYHWGSSRKTAILGWEGARSEIK